MRGAQFGRVIGAGIGIPLAGGWLGVVAVSLVREVGAPPPASPEEALTLVAALGGAVVATWLWAGLVLALLGHLPGRVGLWCRRAAEQTVPRAVRRLAAVVVGASLAGALAPGTALAEGTGTSADAGTAASPAFRATGLPPGPHAPTTSSSTPTSAPIPSSTAPSPGFGSSRVPAEKPSAAGGEVPAPPAPGWTPSRPPVRPQPSTRLVSTAPPAGERPDVVVRRGDTLWDLVRHHLGPDATDAEVAAEWPRWHEANRAVIGPDPGLLLPGQVLRAPAATGALR
ncbi:hypothetical protein P0Y31_12050 [Knoellia sp. 3-2P3]|uniref:LysM peptidoglycan-binding domain-containing protein n=1 Tax=unclassified Knoellia TaxID=2618719 RepID=UPI0023DB1C65|nr:hypothetical protein [Knoellia sp. 3-2P3]MDF2093076.1 hypothetical protein [Knoellia sp. 3-2P3]